MKFNIIIALVIRALSDYCPEVPSIVVKVGYFFLLCFVVVGVVGVVIWCKESFRKRRGLFWLLYLMVASCIRRIKQWLESFKEWLESFKEKEEKRLVIRAIYNSLSPKEKVNLKQEFIRTVLKDDPSLYKRYKNDNKISELFYDEFLRGKLGE